jgi:hypothetical protein
LFAFRAMPEGLPISATKRKNASHQASLDRANLTATMAASHSLISLRLR